MKKVIAIFFLLVFVTSAVHANELLKLPKLFSHYVKHQKEDPSMSFANFIMEHYIEGHGIDGDHAQDMQLPFKTIDHANIVTLLNFPEPFIGSVKAPSYPFQEEFGRGYQSLYLNVFVANIWQPPRA